MKKISSGYTAFRKKGFPVLWFGVIAFVVVTAFVGGAAEKDPMFFVVPGVMMVFGYFMMRKLVWDLVDEVYDCGEDLLVRNGGKEERVPLSNIMNVSASTMTNPPRITLRLVDAGKFGSEVAFSPVTQFTLNPFARNRVAEDLIVRVDRARSRRAR